MKALVYDLEIIKAIPTREPRVEDIEYCNGWSDHANMGVSVIGAYDYVTDRYRVFTKEQFTEFGELMQERTPLVGHNIIGFDNRVLHACGISQMPPETACYDTLAELWAAAGLSRKFAGASHGGFGLDRAAEVNFGRHKTGHGAFAPVDWQRGNIGTVIDYCLEDVRLTRLLFERMSRDGFAIDPRDGRSILRTLKLWILT